MADAGAAWQYHNGTKHSPASVRASRHALDFENQPLPYKIYSSLPPIPLPDEFAPSALPALEAIASLDGGANGEAIPDLTMLARLCYFSNGVTKVLRYPRGDLPFRAAACTGALFHIELYLVCGDLPDLAAGVYHYGAHDNSLRRLRQGDYRQALIEATGREPAIAQAPAVIVATSTFWRNAWKYQARAYRHTYWDSGTVLANLLAEAAALGLPAELVLGFADDEVNRLIGVDGEREAAVELVAVGRGAGEPPPSPPVEPLDLPTAPLSRYEVDYPAIQTMHRASALASGAEAAEWRGEPPLLPVHLATGAVYPLQPLRDGDLPGDPIETVIRRRGSTRRFTQQPISFEQLSTVLDRATRGIRADCLDPRAPLSDLFLIVNAVDGLPNGAYTFRRTDGALELLQPGTFRREAGFLALGQELGADAAVDVYLMTDLAPVLARFGNRGYRVAQLEAAMTAGKLYLAAYALRLGATGLTFFDDEVTAFFSPRAAGQSVMFLIALGHPWRRRP